MNVIDETPTSWLIATENGGTETKTKCSPLNQLLYGHDLFGLLQHGDEIWMKDVDGEKAVTIIPSQESECFTLRLEDCPDLTLGEHHKTDLIEAMAEMYDEHDGESVEPLVALYDEIRSNMAREEVLSVFSAALSEWVEVREDGWYINGHVLLTLEGEIYHPGTNSRKRSGNGVVNDGSSVQAYGLRAADLTSGMDREITEDDETYRLTDREMKFIGKAIWLVENTPNRN
jgi:hypothetical protein